MLGELISASLAASVADSCRKPGITEEANRVKPRAAPFHFADGERENEDGYGNHTRSRKNIALAEFAFVKNFTRSSPAMLV